MQGNGAAHNPEKPFGMHNNFVYDLSELQTLNLGGLVKAKRGGNRTTLVFERGEALVSYSTLVGAYNRAEGRYYFTDAHDYSVTTAKQVTQWSGIGTADRRKGMESGKYGRI